VAGAGLVIVDEGIGKAYKCMCMGAMLRRFFISHKVFGVLLSYA
jgi:hypothetical protein